MWAPDPSFPMGEHSVDLCYKFSSIADFLTCPSPSLLGWSPSALSEAQTPGQELSAHMEAAGSLTAGRDGVCHWQGLLRPQDGSQCQGLFVCLQERLFWHSSKIVTQAGSQTCLFQCIQCKIGSQEKKILREGVCSHSFCSNIATLLFYFMH